MLKQKVSISRQKKVWNRTKRNKTLKHLFATVLVLGGLTTALSVMALEVKRDYIMSNANDLKSEHCGGKTVYYSHELSEELCNYLISQAESETGEARANDPVSVSVEKLIKNTFPDNYKVAIAIAKCESYLDPKIIGDKTTKYQSTGLFQIRELPQRMKYYNLDTEKLQDPVINILMAKIIYDRSGWQPWSCFTQDLYQKHL